MSDLRVFTGYLLHALLRIQGIVYGLFVFLVVNAAAIAYFEEMRFADALYFTLVTGLTIGYGDIAPVTSAGRVVAILAGLVGILITGLVAAIAVYALRETMKPPADRQRIDWAFLKAKRVD